jgi:hypothetical protein
MHSKHHRPEARRAPRSGLTREQGRSGVCPECDCDCAGQLRNPGLAVSQCYCVNAVRLHVNAADVLARQTGQPAILAGSGLKCRDGASAGDRTSA